MREIFEAIRKHPWAAGLTATAILGGVLKFFLDKLVLDGLRDLIFAALGRWLGISDVNALVTLLSYAIPLALAGATIWGVYRLAQYNAGIAFGPTSRLQTKTLGATFSPAQERLLELLAEHQRQFAASKLIINRQTGRLHFDSSPSQGEGANLIRDLYGSSNAVDAAKFEALVESMPSDYIRRLPESRWDNPFVVSLTDAGAAYLKQQATTHLPDHLVRIRAELAAELADIAQRALRYELRENLSAILPTNEAERLITQISFDELLASQCKEYIQLCKVVAIKRQEYEDDREERAAIAALDKTIFKALLHP